MVCTYTATSNQILEQYNKAVPDGAERILKMAEEEGEHRRKRDMTILDEHKRQGKWGQVIALVIAFAILVACSILAYLKNSSWIMPAGIFGIVAIVASSSSKKKD